MKLTSVCENVSSNQTGLTFLQRTDLFHLFIHTYVGKFTSNMEKVSDLNDLFGLEGYIQGYIQETNLCSSK